MLSRCLVPPLALLLFVVAVGHLIEADDGGAYEKRGRLVQLRREVRAYGEERARRNASNLPQNSRAATTARRKTPLLPLTTEGAGSNSLNEFPPSSTHWSVSGTRPPPPVDLLNKPVLTAQRRLIDELLDPGFYEKTVHPRRDHTQPTRINVSMSLYQILDVDERSQSIVVCVWMVQDWWDEFLDWDPADYENLTKTIVPYHQIWVPDTYLYNSETLERKKTEALMNAVVVSGKRDSSPGAHVQLMFPAIYKLSCKMNVRFFPYDQQNCTLSISSWTHDSSTIDYWPTRQNVNLANMAINEEWAVVSFTFVREERLYKCCEKPWVMLFAHLVIVRKPLWHIVNLVVPTSIITIVAITGFFTPTSSSSERDEKLYLGINTLLTLSIMMLMVCNSMPSTSTYVPLMSWYYMGIIFVIVLGTLLATVVLAIHNQKHYSKPVSKWIRGLLQTRLVSRHILEAPATLVELWREFGVYDRPLGLTPRLRQMDPLLAEQLESAGGELPPAPPSPFTPNSARDEEANGGDQMPRRSLSTERRLAGLTREYTAHVRRRERERKARLAAEASRCEDSLPVDASMDGGKSERLARSRRAMRRHKMQRRCALEWEYVANVLDRVLLTVFSCITAFLFALLVGFDQLFTSSTSPHDNQ